LVLGCTHYPLLRDEITALVPPTLAVIDSAESTATFVLNAFNTNALANEPAAPLAIRFYATDGVHRFRDLGTRFLGEPIQAVELVDLGG
jgi:glutamate racemase